MMIITVIFAIVVSAFFTKYWYSLGGTKLEAGLVFVSMSLTITGIASMILP